MRVAAFSRICDSLRRRGWCSTAAEAEIAPEIAPEIATEAEIAPEAAPDMPEIAPDMPEISPEIAPDIAPEIAPKVEEGGGLEQLMAVAVELRGGAGGGGGSSVWCPELRAGALGVARPASNGSGTVQAATAAAAPAPAADKSAEEDCVAFVRLFIFL
jgi:hypothetical protein